jgi:hypothetical protein
MKRFKKIILALLVIFIAIQFIQPARNQNGQVMPTDIEKTLVVPANVSGILKNSCYDCHSSNTHYPWYSFIQPGAWLMASHIKNGKAMLNFSQFGELSDRKQQSKLQGIINQVKDGEMPIIYYTLIHKNAILTKEQKTILLNWAASTKDSLSLKN